MHVVKTPNYKISKKKCKQLVNRTPIIQNPMELFIDVWRK